jgi:hypothetical protein
VLQASTEQHSTTHVSPSKSQAEWNPLLCIGLWRNLFMELQERHQQHLGIHFQVIVKLSSVQLA